MFLNAVPGCILWKQPTLLKRGDYREQNSAQITEYETRMQVETDISNVMSEYKRPIKQIEKFPIQLSLKGFLF